MVDLEKKISRLKLIGNITCNDKVKMIFGGGMQEKKQNTADTVGG